MHLRRLTLLPKLSPRHKRNGCKAIFEAFEAEIMAVEKTGLYTTAEITRALRGGQVVRDLLGGSLETARGVSGWSLGLGFGMFVGGWLGMGDW
jgi:hypothetical protein